MTEAEKALAYAVRLLGKADVLEAELRSRLAAKGFSEAATEEVVAKLKARRFLDDRRAVDDLVDRRTTLAGRGKYRILAELARKGAESHAIEEVAARLDPDSEQARAERWLDRRRFQDAAKAGRFLIGQGFDEEVVRAVLERRFGGEG